jgi:hypothetical protein
VTGFAAAVLAFPCAGRRRAGKDVGIALAFLDRECPSRRRPIEAANEADRGSKMRRCRRARVADAMTVAANESRCRPPSPSSSRSERSSSRPSPAPQLDWALLESSASLGAGRLATFHRLGRYIRVVHRLDRQCSRLAVSIERAHGYAADPHLGHDGGTLDVRVAAASGVPITGVIAPILVMERLVGLSRRLKEPTPCATLPSR